MRKRFRIIGHIKRKAEYKGCLRNKNVHVKIKGRTNFIAYLDATRDFKIRVSRKRNIAIISWTAPHRMRIGY